MVKSNTSYSVMSETVRLNRFLVSDAMFVLVLFVLCFVSENFWTLQSLFRVLKFHDDMTCVGVFAPIMLDK